MSVLCSAESLSRFPCVINTTFRKMIHIRWCCIDRLRPPRFSCTSTPSLAPLALQNKRVIYNLLFHTSAATLLEIRKAKFYKLTGSGKKQLIVETNRWRQMARAIGVIMGEEKVR